MIDEGLLAAKSGLTRAELAKRRKALVQGEDWGRGRHNKVLWTEAGLLKLGIDSSVAAESGPVAAGDAVIVRCNFRNTRLVEAAVDGATRLVLVRDSHMYIPGQKFTVRPNGALGLVESRKPRGRGKF